MTMDRLAVIPPFVQASLAVISDCQLDTAHPYYLYAGDYQQHARGSCVMHLLCHALNQAGLEAYIAAGTVVNPVLQTPVLTTADMERHRAERRLPITVYPGSVDGNPLSSLIVVRYVLERADLETDKDIGNSDSDLIFYYADDVAHGIHDANILTVPFAQAPQSAPPASDELDRFIALTLQAARHRQHRLTPSIAEWLDARQLTPVQQRLLKEKLSAETSSSVMIIVLDTAGAPTSVARTLDSVQRWRNNGATSVSVQVYSVGSPDENLPADTDWARFGASLADQINELMARRDAQWLLLLNAGDELLSNGTCLLDQQLPRSPAALLYYDEIHRHGDQIGAVLRPGVNLDLLISLPVVMAAHWLFRREAFLACGGFDAQVPQALEFDLILRVIEHQGLNHIEHLAEPLICGEPAQLTANPDETAALDRHLRNRGYSGHQISEHPARHYHVRYGHTDEPLVSIIIPTKDQLPLLRRCVESLLEKTRYFNYELIIVDNNSETEEAITWLAEINAIGGQKIRVLPYPHPFNFSAINNFAVSQANGEYLVLLNNDTAIIQENWLDELLNHALRPEVGVVGAKLLYPSGYIQHAGVIAGLGGPAGHPFIGLPATASGYMQRLTVDQNYSVVTAACLMIRRSIYEDVAGMDEDRFKVSYNDVDLCLKVGAQGYLTVWTPHVLLLHEGSVSQTQTDRASFAAKLKRFRSEQHGMLSQWLPMLANDPAYNPNLSLDGDGFDLDGRTELTWRPLKRLPVPALLVHPADTAASSQRRIALPFTALREAGEVDGVLSPNVLGAIDTERYQPDAIVLHRRLSEPRLALMRDLKTFSRSFKTLDIDCLPNDREISNAVQVAHTLIDRIVVSTPALAELFASAATPVIVLPTRLNNDWARPLPARQPHSRLRIGCFVSTEQHSDLALIEALMQRLGASVEWVLLGSNHPRLSALAVEQHGNAHFWNDRDKLLELNLDLALIPLRDHLSNHCRDHSLLLEYGACGVPVICSDVAGFRSELPVTRLGGSTEDWLKAILDALHARDALMQQGEALRRAVIANWIQNAESLRAHCNAWLP